MPIILHASKADILANNVTCIKSEIKKFETYLYDLVLPMVNSSWLVHNYQYTVLSNELTHMKYCVYIHVNIPLRDKNLLHILLCILI